MLFRRKKKTLQKLESLFGHLKTEEFNFQLITRYTAHKDHSSAFQEISNQTGNDLDFDLFFCFVDRTSSKIGQQFLYDRLKTIDDRTEEFVVQEKIITYLEKNPKERLEIQYLLNKLNNHQTYYIPDLFQKEIERKPKWFFLFPILSFTAILSILLSFFNPNVALILFGLFPINILIHYGLKRKTTLFLNSVPSLLATGAVAKNLLKVKVIRDSFSEISPSIKVIASIRRNMSFFKLEQKVDSDMEAAYWFLLELIKITFLLEPLLLFSSLDKLQNKAKDIENVFRFIGQVDTFVSVTSLRKGEPYCIPTINKDNRTIQFTDLRHPLVPHCVPNSVDAQKSILLTGSNMSGKTTFIRSIGLNYISGMALNTCFASTASLPIARLFSVIRIEDDVLNASSYFYREVDEIKEIIEQSGKSTRSIILLDELFKGTNTAERIAAAKAVLSYLEQQNSQIFVSTHDIELTTLLGDKFDLFHFTESIVDSSIYFDYKIKKGISQSGNALKIIAIHQYPEAIVKEAEELLHTMKRNY